MCSDAYSSPKPSLTPLYSWWYKLSLLWSWCKLKKIITSRDLPHHLDSTPNNPHYSYGVPRPLGIHRLTFLYSALLPSLLSSWFFLLLDLHSHFLSHQTVSLRGHRLDSTDHTLQSPLSLHGSWGGAESCSHCWTGWVVCAVVGWALDWHREDREKGHGDALSNYCLSPTPPTPAADRHVKKEESFYPRGKINCEDDGKATLKESSNMGNCKNHWVRDRNWKKLTFVMNFHGMLHKI